jgi:hypothetical protein
VPQVLAVNRYFPAHDASAALSHLQLQTIAASRCSTRAPVKKRLKSEIQRSSSKHVVLLSG